MPRMRSSHPGARAGESLNVEERSAFTSGGMKFLDGDGTPSVIPAGACSVTPRYKPGRYLVRWQEGTLTRSAEIADAMMISYLRGCIVQYA